MKVEQLCRFRTDDAGYRVFARSEGITQQVEANHAKFFTSAMDPLFKVDGRLTPGKSVLTYNGTEEDFFIGLSTMRTDINSRPSIFHHTFFIPRSEYVRIMREDPGAILGIDVSGMLTSQHEVDSSVDSSFELNEMNSLNLNEEQLRGKYGLDNEKYARLLIGAYRAVTTGRSIKLVTKSECNALDLVREFAYCIAVGMPPSIRGRITVSSAMDTKTSVCLSAPNGGEAIGTAAFEYNIDVGTASSNLNVRSDVLDVFIAIAQMNCEERTAYFGRIEKAVDLVVPVEMMNYELFLAAHFLCNEDIDGKEQNILTWISAANSRLANSIKLDGYYRINANLIQHLNNKSVGVDMFADEIFDHYIAGKKDGVDYENEAEFEKALVKNIQYCSLESSKSLLLKIIDSEALSECGTMIHALIRQIGEDSEFYNSEQATTFVSRILKENAVDLIEAGLIVVDGFSVDNTVKLTQTIIDNTASRGLSECEVCALNILVSKLIEKKRVLSTWYCLKLDEHYSDYDEALTDTCIEYFINVRLAEQGSVQEQFSALLRLKDAIPGFYALILKTISENPSYQGNGLWEKYQSAVCFDSEKLYQYDELLAILNKYNVFQTADGEFEGMAKKLWMERYNRDLKECESLDDRYIKGAAKSLSALRKANFSRTSTDELNRKIMNAFWETAPYRLLIIDNKTDMPQGMFVNATSTKALAKARLCELCKRFEKTKDTGELCVLMLTEHDSFSGVALNEIKRCFFILAERIARTKKYMNLDLLLLSCISFGNTGYEIDCDCLIDELADSDSFERIVSVEIRDSYIIQRNSNVGKNLKKAASKGKTQICKVLEKELASDETFFKKLFGKGGKRDA